ANHSRQFSTSLDCETATRHAENLSCREMHMPLSKSQQKKLEQWWSDKEITGKCPMCWTCRLDRRAMAQPGGAKGEAIVMSPSCATTAPFVMLFAAKPIGLS